MSINIIEANNPNSIPLSPDLETICTHVVLRSGVRTHPSLDINNCQLKQPAPNVTLHYTKSGKQS